MNPENWTSEIVETSTRTKILEERFDRHLIQIEAAIGKLDSKISVIADGLISNDKAASEKHFHINDRLVKLESERGILAKVVQTIFATITGGVAGWLAKHS